jgi:SAM-dependent methyltransferase
MSWSQIVASFNELTAARRTGSDLKSHWERFAAAVNASASDPPLHLRLILQGLANFQGKRRSDIEILDHGCGGGRTLLCLLAMGFEGIYGVDIGGDCEEWNRLLNDELGLSGKRIFVYDGKSLPFADGKFDFVFSQQVLEHVGPDALENYYADERRVMKAGAIAYHQVPHRLVPYDSHTRTWLIHYLPRPLWLGILRRMGRNMLVPETALFLRWPWVHRRLVRQHLGACEDRTLSRFMSVSDLSDYDGPRGLRRWLARLLNLPVIGAVARWLLPNFVMLDTLSRVS